MEGWIRSSRFTEIEIDKSLRKIDCKGEGSCRRSDKEFQKLCTYKYYTLGKQRIPIRIKNRVKISTSVQMSQISRKPSLSIHIYFLLPQRLPYNISDFNRITISWGAPKAKLQDTNTRIRRSSY